MASGKARRLAGRQRWTGRGGAGVARRGLSVLGSDPTGGNSRLSRVVEKPVERIRTGTCRDLPYPRPPASSGVCCRPARSSRASSACSSPAGPGDGRLDVSRVTCGAPRDVAHEPCTARQAHRQSASRRRPRGAAGRRRRARRPRRRSSRPRAGRAWRGTRPPRSAARARPWARRRAPRAPRSCRARARPGATAARAPRRGRRARSRRRRRRTRPRRSGRPRRSSRRRPSAGRPARASRPACRLETTSSVPAAVEQPAVARPAAAAPPARRCRRAGSRVPRACGTRPVAFATAAISTADFVPSRKEQNICALRPAVCSGGSP